MDFLLQNMFYAFGAAGGSVIVRDSVTCWLASPLRLLLGKETGAPIKALGGDQVGTDRCSVDKNISIRIGPDMGARSSRHACRIFSLTEHVFRISLNRQSVSYCRITSDLIDNTEYCSRTEQNRDIAELHSVIHYYGHIVHG